MQTLPPLQFNKIYLGDSFKLYEQIPAKTVDLILEDMPYNITACDWDVKIDLQLYWETRLRILKPTGVVCLTASQPFTTDLINSNRKMFKYEWIWNKVNGSNFMNLKNRPFKTQEQILIFSSTAKFIFNPIRTARTIESYRRVAKGEVRLKVNNQKKAHNHYNIKGDSSVSIVAGDGLKHPIDIITFPKSDSEFFDNNNHPTRKPVALFEYLIRTYTNEGDLVFDGFGGSGTTAVAAHKSKRNFIVIEKEKKYFDLATKRLSRERSQFTLL